MTSHAETAGNKVPPKWQKILEMCKRTKKRSSTGNSPSPNTNYNNMQSA